MNFCSLVIIRLIYSRPTRPPTPAPGLIQRWKEGVDRRCDLFNPHDCYANELQHVCFQFSMKYSPKHSSSRLCPDDTEVSSGWT